MIERIPGVRGAQAYLYRASEGLVVIDPGYTGSFRAVLRFLGKRGFAPADLSWVILTHHHVDHAGTALALCQATGAKLAIHRADAPYLRAGRPRERSTFWGMADWLPVWAARYLMSCAACELRLLEDGESIAGLMVLHAPGHTPGSICLYAEQQSALFVGDVLNNERGLNTPPWSVNHSHREARQAPNRLAGLSYRQAFFGHGRSLTERADERVASFLAPTLPGKRGSAEAGPYSDVSVDAGVPASPRRRR